MITERKIGKSLSFPQKKQKRTVVYGVLVGLLNGLFGGGGGTLLIPLLTEKYRFPERVAHATTLFIMLPVTAVSCALYASGNAVNWGLSLPTALGVTVGGAFGALFIGKIPPKILKIAFIVLTFSAGLTSLLFGGNG